MPRPHTMYSVSALDGSATISLPNPDTTSGEGLIATLVNQGRNASAVVVAQKIGRDQDKVTCNWNYLTKEEWEEMAAFWNRNFYFNFRFYSPVLSDFTTRKCYISDRKYKYFQADAEGKPTAYKECSASIVDTGEGSL